MSAEVHKVGDRIILVTTGGDFDANLEKCRAVGAGRFVKQPRKGWSYPLTVDKCHDLRRVWGGDLKVAESLAEWYVAAREQRAAVTARMSATDATLARLPQTAPALAAALDPPQRVGALAVAEPYRDALLVADEPGSGKTLEVIGGILEADLQGPILVACPRLSVKPVWHNELRKWAPNERVYMMRGTRAKRQRSLDRFNADPAPRKWLIMVGESLRIKESNDPVVLAAAKQKPREDGKPQFVGFEYPGLFQNRYAATVVDESHKAFGSLTVVKGTLWGKGLKRLATDRRYAVTGTPFGKGGRLQGMFGTLHWLWSDEFTSFWRWAEEHFHVEEEEHFIKGGRGKTATSKRVGDLRGGKDAEGFLADLGPRILRRTKRETMPWLADKEYFDVLCEMSGKQERQYQAMLDEGEFAVEGGVITVDGVLAAITRAKQLANGAIKGRNAHGKPVFDPAESCKIDRLIERLDTHGVSDGTSDMKVLVVSQYNEFLEALRTRLGKTEHFYLVGSTSDRNRDHIMERFQEPGGPQICILNARAGGVSVTLDAADEVHMLDEDWDPGNNTQVEDRIHRRSRGKDRPPARIYLYRTEGTLDTNIGDDVEQRRQAQFAVLDGRRGIEYVREVARYRKPTEEE